MNSQAKYQSQIFCPKQKYTETKLELKMESIKP